MLRFRVVCSEGIPASGNLSASDLSSVTGDKAWHAEVKDYLKPERDLERLLTGGTGHWYFSISSADLILLVLVLACFQQRETESCTSKIQKTRKLGLWRLFWEVRKYLYWATESVARNTDIYVLGCEGRWSEYVNICIGLQSAFVGIRIFPYWEGRGYLLPVDLIKSTN